MGGERSQGISSLHLSCFGGILTMVVTPKDHSFCGPPFFLSSSKSSRPRGNNAPLSTVPSLCNLFKISELSAYLFPSRTVTPLTWTLPPSTHAPYCHYTYCMQCLKEVYKDMQEGTNYLLGICSHNPWLGKNVAVWKEFGCVRFPLVEGKLAEDPGTAT